MNIKRDILFNMRESQTQRDREEREINRESEREREGGEREIHSAEPVEMKPLTCSQINGIQNYNNVIHNYETIITKTLK